MLKLAGNNIVQVLDIEKGESWRGPLETLFQNYAAQLTYEKPKDGCMKTTFHPNDLHITDWTGWSKVECIIRYMYDRECPNKDWVKLSVKGSSVVCTTESVVLDWQDAYSRRSFQGRPLWSYEAVALSDLKLTSVGRVLDLNDSSPVPFFDKYVIEPIEHDYPVFYEIYTHSRFYNVNKILDASICRDHTGWK